MTILPATCDAIERLAGAIALGEAGDAERETYRNHLAACPHCLRELSGEREIERVMSAIVQARAEERWEPHCRPMLARKPSPRFGWAAVALLAAAIALVVGIRITERPQQAPLAQRSVTAPEARAIAVLNTQTLPHREGRAESLAVGPEATLAVTVEVNVNAHGTPVGCRITTSSGNGIFDRSICRSAMRARYALHQPAHR